MHNSEQTIVAGYQPSYNELSTVFLKSVVGREKSL